MFSQSLRSRYNKIVVKTTYILYDLFIMENSKKLIQIEIARRLRERMSELHFTYLDLASRVGITTSQVSHYLTCKRHINNYYLQKIAKAIGVTPGWLAYGECMNGEMTTKLDEISSKINDMIIPCLTASEIEPWLAYPVLKGDHKVMSFPDYNDLSKSTFSLEITNNALTDTQVPERGLSCGDIAIVDVANDKPLKSGDFVLAKFGPMDFRFRQYQQDGQEILLTGVDSRLPITPLNDDIEIIGVVVYTMSKPRLRR